MMQYLFMACHSRNKSRSRAGYLGFLFFWSNSISNGLVAITYVRTPRRVADLTIALNLPSTCLTLTQGLLPSQNPVLSATVSRHLRGPLRLLSHLVRLYRGPSQLRSNGARSSSSRSRDKPTTEMVTINTRARAQKAHHHYQHRGALEQGVPAPPLPPPPLPPPPPPTTTTTACLRRMRGRASGRAGV
jgi:hypothetical protein